MFTANHTLLWPFACLIMHWGRHSMLTKLQYATLRYLRAGGGEAPLPSDAGAFGMAVIFTSEMRQPDGTYTHRHLPNWPSMNGPRPMG